MHRWGDAKDGRDGLLQRHRFSSLNPSSCLRPSKPIGLGKKPKPTDEDIHPPISADTIDFPHAGDHKAVRVTVMNPLGPRPAPPSVIGNVSHWPSSLFRKFSRHMSQWSKAHSTHQDYIMHPLDRADAIIAAASSFVQAHPRPQPFQDAVEQQLADELHRNPTSKRAQQAWAHHRATNNMKRAQRHLRRFRKCAVRGRSTFFNALKWWLITPFRTTSPQPDTTSAAEHLPHFAGDPPWRPEEAKALLSQVLEPGRPVSPDPPSWQSFTKALRQPKNKAAGMDHVAPHLYQWLPRELQWDLYIAVRHVWESGNVPHHWLQARIAMIYKSGPPEAARSYRPISVATGMYSILARLILETDVLPKTYVLFIVLTVFLGCTWTVRRCLTVRDRMRID